MSYFSNVIGSTFSFIFVVFMICAIGYLLGAIEIKGISLGTAGVLLAALLYGIMANFIPSFTIGGQEVVLFDAELKADFNLVSNIGTALFVTSVGLIAGPKFFRSLNRSFLHYILMGFITILVGAVVTVIFIMVDQGLNAYMAAGLMTGALTSTPGLSAAKEVAGDGADMVTAGYGIAYLFGVLGVVLFVQLMPRIMHVDIAKEREKFVAAGSVQTVELKRDVKQVDPFGFFPFMLAIALGCIIGAFYIPGINFSLGNSGGCLVAGLIVGHFGHIGGIDLRMQKATLNFMRELGLALFLIGAGVPGGVNFITNVKISYFIFGALITLVPMIGGFILGTKVFRLDFFNTLGSITGGMTSTPALGALIATAGTDEVASSYAATYPIALVCVVIAVKIIVMVL